MSPVPFSLESFRVVGLHGFKDYSVKFADNRLVLVGENGMGKSTFAKLLFYTITRQWSRLKNVIFKYIYLRIDGRDFAFGSEQLALYLRHKIRLRQRYYRRYRSHYDELPDEAWDDVAYLAAPDDIGAPKARQLILDLPEAREVNLAGFIDADEALEACVDAQVLFLPTYRRIEQELKAIFPGLESDIAKYRDGQAGRSPKRHAELVEFGMEDVEDKIKNTMDDAKDFARAGLNRLMGAYLRDVIGALPTVDMDAVRKIDTGTLTSMIERIDEDALPITDKRALLNTIAEMKTRPERSMTEHDSVVAHFLLKVYALYQERQTKEHRIREFVRVCNGYLDGKELVYDDLSFTVNINPTGESVDNAATDPDGRTLTLKTLSSGEKQIVSLFAHIYLSSMERFFIIIDEPELSLSVEWQRKFLPDILRTGKCSGLIAATHSPFIWENELEPYVHSLTEFLNESVKTNEPN
jgi:predicted ATPase